MGTSPKVSVVMSAFNAEKYLRESLDSILNQDFWDFEFLIVNDASTDKTKEIIESCKDQRIVIINNAKNSGLTRSLNVALNSAKGEYVARQDADDISLPNRLSAQVDFLEKHPEVGFVGSYASMIDRHGKEFGQWRMPAVDKDIRLAISDRGCFCHGAVMFRNQLVKNIGGYREQFKYAQDLDLWLRLSERCQMANIDEILYKMRRSANSITRKKLEKQLDFHLLAVCLSRQRAKEGRDELEMTRNFNLKKQLSRHYANKEINQFKSEIYLHYYHESLKMKNLGDVSLFWLGWFIRQPKLWKVKTLFKDVQTLRITSKIRVY
jgi:glycosyltransferase involved in cell wall biosynthesis